MSEQGQPYRVLARKYRPARLTELIGQDAMVRALSNAFASGRIAHAFMLSGVRGTGKTSTARIIAMGLNCIGPDGKSEMPTVEPCGECVNCEAISAGRNIDVMELDAASNTQVEKMREILAGVPYRPTETRYKIYIFDEVHMLSTSAFNALLKTLEEPPKHVKFIFATTEIRKIPVTVISRCQRFDLRRIEPDQMAEYLRELAGREDIAVADEAIRLIVRAAEGSMRDALSLLDQAIALGGGELGAADIRAMIGLADQSRIFDLFEAVMGGETRAALEELRALYADGADPASILSELAELTHLVSLLSIAERIEDDALGPDDQERAKALAGRLTLPILARAWQMLLKLGTEIELAPSRLMGAEMAIIRLCHVADQPPPAEIIKRFEGTNSTAPRPSQNNGPSGASPTNLAPPTMPTQQITSPGDDQIAGGEPPKMRDNGGGHPGQKKRLRQAGGRDIDADALARFSRFEDVLGLIEANRDYLLQNEIETHLRLARYSPGRIEFSLKEGASMDFPARLAKRLRDWTGQNWGVTLVQGCEAPTIAERRNLDREEMHEGIEKNPLIARIKAHFPGAEILDIAPASQGEPPQIIDEEGWDLDALDDIGLDE